MIVKELQILFGEIYLVGKNTIDTDLFLIIANIRMGFQMDVDCFEGLLYTILSEEPFNNHRFHMTEEMDDYTTNNCVSQHFSTLIRDTMACLTCHLNKRPKLLKDESFNIPLGEVSCQQI